MLNRADRITVNKFLRETYPGARNISYEEDGAVTCTVDEMPGTNKGGRIFAGWDDELLKHIKEGERRQTDDASYQSK